MNSTNLPGFTAEASGYRTGNYRVMSGISASGTSAAVEGALMKELAFKCTGTCPEGQLLCESDNNCLCCKGGCYLDNNGQASCLNVTSSVGQIPTVGLTYA